MSKAADPFAEVRAQTNRHRSQHGCGAYPYGNGALLGAVAAATNAKRILELGTALGYTALWFARGAPDAHIDTVEGDGDHVRLARENFAAQGVAGRVRVHEGDFAAVLPKLKPGYDLAFFDGFSPTLDWLAGFMRLLRPRGVLLSGNLTHGGRAVQDYRDALFDARKWLTAYVGEDRETALSVKL